jgi:hypothetical protein
MSAPYSSITAGVSGGAAVSGMVNGVALQLAGDYAYLLPSNAAPTPGPDTQGTIVASPGLLGGYGANAQLAFEKVMSFSDFQNSNWTAIQGWIPLNTGLPLATNLYTLTVSQTLNLTVPLVQGFYALRVRLAIAPTSGYVVISGSSFPAPGIFTAAEQAMLQNLTLLSTANVLAQCDQTSQDYIQLAQGYSYP